MHTQPAIKALLQRALCAIVLCLCCVLCAPPAPAHADASRKAVLYLNSYHNGYSWSDDILAGIRKVLEASGRALVFQVEYMDSKKFLYKETEQTLYRLYRDKFRDTRFDLIIASDNAAMDFLTRFRDELFPGVPVVFCGLNDVKPESLRGRNMTGVIEDYDVAANIELALRFNPQLRRMVIIGDDSVTGAAIRNQVMAQVAPLRDRIEVEEWTDYRLDQMLAWVREQPADTFFYFVPIYRDIGGLFYTAEELLQKVRANSRAPLYSNWEFLLDHGIVGGKLISGVRHGEMAAELALRVLDGEKADAIPIIERADEEYMFDNKELTRLFISRSMLPPRQRGHQRTEQVLRAQQAGLLDHHHQSRHPLADTGAAGHEHPRQTPGRGQDQGPAFVPAAAHRHHSTAGLQQGRRRTHPRVQPRLPAVLLRGTRVRAGPIRMAGG